MLLNIPNPDAIKLRGVVYDSRPADDQIAANDVRMNLAHLKQLASLNRPDLLSQRWTLYRAFADVEAVRASRFDDVTFLVQPYTYSPMFPNRTAWAGDHGPVADLQSAAREPREGRADCRPDAGRALFP